MSTGSLISLNGQIGLLPSPQIGALAGGYFVATNPTPGTGLQSDLITGYSATADGHCVIVNGNSAPGAYIVPDYIRFMMTGTAPTGTTVMNLACFTDVSASATPSAGSVALTPVNVNPGSALSSGASVYVPTGGAAMTIPAASVNRRLVGRAAIPTSLGITGDSYTLRFGATGDNGAQGGGTAVRATAAASLEACTTPVAIAAGYGLIVDMWWLTQAANKPVFEWEIGFWVVQND